MTIYDPDWGYRLWVWVTGIFLIGVMVGAVVAGSIAILTK